MTGLGYPPPPDRSWDQRPLGTPLREQADTCENSIFPILWMRFFFLRQSKQIFGKFDSNHGPGTSFRPWIDHHLFHSSLFFSIYVEIFLFEINAKRNIGGAAVLVVC